MEISDYSHQLLNKKIDEPLEVKYSGLQMVNPLNNTSNISVYRVVGLSTVEIYSTKNKNNHWCTNPRTFAQVILGYAVGPIVSEKYPEIVQKFADEIIVNLDEQSWTFEEKDIVAWYNEAKKDFNKNE